MFALESTNILFSRAQELGLRPVLLNSYGLMEIEVNEAKHFVFHTKTHLNSQLSSYVVSNKHTTRVILDRYSFPNIPYSLPATKQEAAVFFDEHGPIVIKPTYGQGSQNVKLASTNAELDTIDTSQSILEKYIKGQEERHLVLNGEVIAVHLKMYDGPINTHTNLHRVSLERSQWDDERRAMAVGIAKVFGLGFAAVDFIVTDDSSFVVLEVNSAPGLAWFHSPTSGPTVDVAGKLLQAMVDTINAE